MLQKVNFPDKLAFVSRSFFISYYI